MNTLIKKFNKLPSINGKIRRLTPVVETVNVLPLLKMAGASFDRNEPALAPLPELGQRLILHDAIKPSASSKSADKNRDCPFSRTRSLLILEVRRGSTSEKIIFKLDEGPKVRIEDIDFAGNTVFTDDELRDSQF